MSKFCGSCGAIMEDDAPFCENCGAAVEQEAAKPQLNKKLLIIAVAALAAVIAVCCIVFGGSSYKTPIDNMIAVTFKGKANKIKNMAPKEYWEYMEDEYDRSLEDYVDDFEDSYDDMKDELEDEYGKRIKVKYKVTDKDKIDKDDLKAIAEYLNDKYDIKKSAVKKGYDLELEMTIKGSEDKDENDSEISVIKIGSKWYGISYHIEDDEASYVSFMIGG